MGEMRVVVVLDMDETLGVFQNDVFHVRPHVNFMLEMLLCMDVDIVLWSLGEDDYVRFVVNGYLPLVKAHAYKLFARTEAKVASRLYGASKSGYHIRTLYEEDIFLLGVDDQAKTNMDTAYDLPLAIPPYRKPDPNDRAILGMCEKLVRGIRSIQLEQNKVSKTKYDRYGKHVMEVLGYV